MSGTLVLLRHAVRRDRLRVPLWVLGLAVLYLSQAVSVDGLYADQAEFDLAARAMEGNAAFVALAGPARALNTVGGQVMWQSSAFGAVLAGVMSMLLVVRHTRAEEESGRDELVRAAPVGRYAALSAAGLWAATANLLAGLAVGGGLAAYGLEAADSLGTGLGLTLVGWCFTAVAMVGAQLSSHSGGVYALTGGVIGAAFALRAVGDVARPALSWLSPIGWYQAMHPFSGLRWWPGLLLLAVTAVLVAVSYAVLVRRDAGSGVLASRAGPDRATARLVAVPRLGLGLAWRLQRALVLAWAVGLLLSGLSMGSVGDTAADMVGDSALAQDIFGVGGEDLVDGFFATVLVMLGLLTAGFAVSSALRSRPEELAHGEVLLSTALTRVGWLLGHTVVGVLGTVLVLAAGALGIGLGYALTTADGAAGLELGRFAMSYLAPVLVLSGLARLLLGLAPRAAGLAWAGLAFAAVVVVLGDTLRLPGWLQALSPFEHLAAAPAEPFSATPVLLLLALALGLSVAGHLALARRDVG